MIAIYHKSIKDSKLKTLENFQSGSWIYVESPTAEELDKLAADFSLERDLLEDAKDLQEVPRQEIENDIIYIFTRIPHEDHLVSATIPILFVLGRDFVITVTQYKPSFVEKFFSGQINFNTAQITRLFIQLFHQINVEYNRSINSISRQVRGMHIQFQNITNEDIVRFVTFESALNDFLAALIPTSNILKDLLSGKHLKLHEKDGELVEDLFLANGQLMETCRSTLKNISTIRNAYSTIMTNDLNRVIKLLTALTIIFSVPTIVASFYGMNVMLPIAENNQAFWFIGGGTIVSTVILFLLFKKNRWL